MTPVQVAALLAALLALRPPPGVLHHRGRPDTHPRACIEATRAAIEAAAIAGQSELEVPPAVLLAVGRRETHFGCNGESDWGAPASRTARHTAGTPRDAARVLSESFAVCHSWRGAIGRFRSGLCDPWQTAHRNYVAGVMRDIERTHVRARINLPPAL